MDMYAHVFTSHVAYLTARLISLSHADDSDVDGHVALFQKQSVN